MSTHKSQFISSRESVWPRWPGWTLAHPHWFITPHSLTPRCLLAGGPNCRVMAYRRRREEFKKGKKGIKKETEEQKRKGKEQTDKISTTRNMRSKRNGEAKKILTALWWKYFKKYQLWGTKETDLILSWWQCIFHTVQRVSERVLSAKLVRELSQLTKEHLRTGEGSSSQSVAPFT